MKTLEVDTTSEKAPKEAFSEARLQRKRYFQNFYLIKLEREVNTMEQQDPMFEEPTDNQAKAWIQENLRIIVSVFIVAAIALGIYSYSQRTNTVADEDGTSLLDSVGGDDSEEATDEDSDTMTDGDTDTTDTTVTDGTQTGVVVTPELSRETETSFVEQAEAGNGTTHLARHALAHYLDKNTDSSLTAEHKIYIEDYLRKNAAHTGALTTGASVEFSKDLIRQAIDQSKTLSDGQLQNLKKYSARVSAYR